MYIYAGMPEKIALFSDVDGNPQNFISRNSFFYISLGVIVIVNGLFITYNYFAKTVKNESTSQYMDSLRVWSNGLLALVNIFFITALIFLSAFNSLERLDLYNIGLIIYVALGLIFLWTLGIIRVLMQKNKM
jgi:predicted transporter